MPPTNTNKQNISSIRNRPPSNRSSVVTDVERTKQLKNERHPMFKYEAKRIRFNTDEALSIRQWN